MKSENFRLKSNGKPIFAYKWSPEDLTEAEGVVQISHGMAEHGERYEEFAEHLVDSNYIVYANDHRGHGKTAEDVNGLGHFADENGWSLVVDDMHNLTNKIIEDHPELPIFLFGHSMGSLLSRDFISKYENELEGTILSGTSGDPGAMSNILITIAKIKSFFGSKDSECKFLNNLIFGQYNDNFKPTRTDFDWLTRDESEVNQYIEDPYCGNPGSAQFFIDLFTGLKRVSRMENAKRIPKDLPILLISGENDPVGDFGDGVMETHNLLTKAGVKDVSYKLYKEARHEILNEINKDEVVRYIIDWLKDHNK